MYASMCLGDLLFLCLKYIMPSGEGNFTIIYFFVASPNVTFTTTIYNITLPLKMLGQYLHTLINGDKCCSTLYCMLSILNELTLQKEWQKFMTNNVLLDKKNTQQQQRNKKNIKTLAKAGDRTRYSSPI